MLLNDNNNLIKKVTFFYDSKNTNMAGPPSSQSELSYEHTYFLEYSATVWHPRQKYNSDKLAYMDSAIKKTRKQSSHSILQNYQQFGCGTTFMSGKG